MATLIRRLFLMKMKKCYYLIFSVSLSLLSIIYFFGEPKQKIREELDDKISALLPNYNVHIFYNARFRNKRSDGAYEQWNYKEIDVDKRIASAFYPSLGLYSSNDPATIDIHMRQIKEAGIGVVVVLWWPEQFDNAPPMDLLFNYAEKYRLKITIQIQNYKNRNIVNLKKNLNYFFKKYRHHAALYKTTSSNSKELLPLIYIYDSYLIKTTQWNILLGYRSRETVRGTDLDAIYIGLLVQPDDEYLILNADFDGFYSYFAINNFTYGSAWFQWPYIQDFARERNVIFIPTVGPGYNDRSQSNNFVNQEQPHAKRRDGIYYSSSWARAIISRAKFVSINSFNDWQFGTQIEPAQPKTVKDKEDFFSYENYAPGSPDHYLKITRFWVIDFANRSTYRTF